MSQFFYSPMNTRYLMSSSSKEPNPSHPIFWSNRPLMSKSSSCEAISWSYPPKTNIITNIFAGISEKFANFSHNYTNNTINNQLFDSNSQIKELLSTQISRKIGSNSHQGLHLSNSLDMAFSESDYLTPLSSSADRTAFISDDERVISVDNCDESIDSDSSNDKSNKIQICDSKVVQSMQNDRQKKKKRKRKRRKKKSLSKSRTSMSCSPTPCFSMSFSHPCNDYISIIIDGNSSFDSDEDMSCSDEELTCFVDVITPDLEMMCTNLFVDCFFNKTKSPNNTNTHNSNDGIDEIDCCPSFSNQICSSTEPQLTEEEKEMTAIQESIKKANERWNSNYCDVSSDDRLSAKVNFSKNKPSIRTIHVWDYASRQARCGHWEQLARDRQRFAERCRRIDSDIGYIFSEEHRHKVYRDRIF